MWTFTLYVVLGVLSLVHHREEEWQGEIWRKKTRTKPLGQPCSLKQWVAHGLLVVGGQEREAQRRGGLDDEGGEAWTGCMVNV